MARPIGKMFYDEIPSMDFLNENPWIEIYYENCRKVVEYLKATPHNHCRADA